MRLWHVSWAAVAALLVACGGESSPADSPDADNDGSTPRPTSTSGATSAPDATASRPDPSRSLPSAAATVVPAPGTAEFDPEASFDVIEYLAEEIGPREGSSEAFDEAADTVQGWFAELGYEVTQVPVPVPAGNSWGVDVPSGESANVIAEPPDFDPTEPHVIIGAHLDTVPQAPGAEDNASGVGVMIELARLSATEPPDLPVRFIAFGAEEPRGDGDDLHHFGSQQYVEDMPAEEREALAAMVSLDRVGVPADHVPVCTAGTGGTDIQDALVDAAEDAGVPTETCENRASDHWSFEKADLPSARLGSVSFAGYHSPDDVPSVIDTGQLAWVGSIMWAWLSSS
ncbi:Zn-dependent exopeptidase M28 [Actinobacteria bacterium YIM 96077]|uniref:Zn-dependent exopeptidase M28 n=2 Tax=Phytoactinopolyspora halophila TaxID=1981511 RepID=A0A329R1K6_9ACTN|nr:Zn-dependent exopeptidase M28 [Actinobacteria bacterium YIM 96077]RAW17839.1 Zn-dependent exopeptidase M28 [Phytoactinopolyspora halophila]